MKKVVIKSTDVWDSEKYYRLARSAIIGSDDSCLKTLKNYAKNAKRVLDVGCGEGSRLYKVMDKRMGFGVDVSSVAIKIAQKHYKNKFSLITPYKIPYSDGFFDMVYSAYVLEHVGNPERFIVESGRVLKKGGYLIFVAPNYGSPNRVSPVYRGSRWKKLLKGIKNDIFLSENDNLLNWGNVTPVTDIKKYRQDYDTCTEPYLRSLLSFLKTNNYKILEWDSFWKDELDTAKFHQKCFRALSNISLYPFTMWGPKLMVVCQKN